jgi:DNA-binding HxlR family transcriptional regulator
MRKTPAQLERQISACLAQHDELDYAALMNTAAANSPLLARTLDRMRLRGSIVRTVLPTTPQRTLYRLSGENSPEGTIKS